jgi:ABC-type proline/glycine betaine transport system permease subunit
LRGFAEALGATVTWEPQTRTVTAVHGATVVAVVIDIKAGVVNGGITPHRGS